MEIILLERISRLGHMGDVVRVKNGFARNFLLPQGKAMRSTPENRKQFEKRREELIVKDVERKGKAEKIAQNLSKKSFTIIRSGAETGQLYGSVSTRDIADLLSSEGFSILRHQIGLNHPIKSTGFFNVEIFLHPEVALTISLNVARNMEEAENQAKTSTSSKEKLESDIELIEQEKTS